MQSWRRVNKVMCCNQSGASDNANRERQLAAVDTPLAVRFTAIVSKLSDLFFYQALPHLIPDAKLAARE